MPDLSSLLERNFKGETFPKDRDLVLTIKEVKAAEVGADKDVKPVAYFLEDPRGLALNGGNYAALTKAHNNPNTDKWPGAKITVHFDPTVKMNGKVTGGLVITKVQPAAK